MTDTSTEPPVPPTRTATATEVDAAAALTSTGRRDRPPFEPATPPVAMERPTPTKAQDVLPGDQILRVHTVTRVVLDDNGKVAITTDDDATHVLGADDGLALWPPGTFPPL